MPAGVCRVRCARLRVQNGARVSVACTCKELSVSSGLRLPARARVQRCACKGTRVDTCACLHVCECARARACVCVCGRGAGARGGAGSAAAALCRGVRAELIAGFPALLTSGFCGHMGYVLEFKRAYSPRAGAEAVGGCMG